MSICYYTSAYNSINKNAEDGTGSHRPLLGDVGIVTLPHSCTK